MKSPKLDKDTQTTIDRIANLRRIDPRVVAAIIGEGLFSGSDRYSRHEAIEHMADRAGANTVRARLVKFAKALDAQHVSSRVQDAKGRASALDEVAYEMASDYGDAGFLVGLAVGMALGSGQPFAAVTSTGSRPKGRAK